MKHFKIVFNNGAFLQDFAPGENCIQQRMPKLEAGAQDIAQSIYRDFPQGSIQMAVQSGIMQRIDNIAQSGSPAAPLARRIISDFNFLDVEGWIPTLRAIGPGYYTGVTHRFHTDIGAAEDDKGRITISYADETLWASNHECDPDGAIMEPHAYEPTEVFNLKAGCKPKRIPAGDRIRFLGRNHFVPGSKGFIHTVRDVQPGEDLRLVIVANPPTYL